MNWKVKNDFIGINTGKEAITVMKADFNDKHLAILKARAKNRNQDEAEYLLKVGLIPSSPQKEMFEEAEVPKKRSKK
jgi:hypothetical protein